MSIYQEIVAELQAIAEEIETETDGYTDFEQPDPMGFIEDNFNSVWEDRS